MLLERGGNVETSRMARLGGEFAILMLVSMPAEQFSSLENDLEILAGSGHKVTTTPAEQTYAEAHPAGSRTGSRSRGPITRGSSTKSLTTSRNRVSVSKPSILSLRRHPPAAFLSSP